MNLTPYTGAPRRTVIIHGIRVTTESPKVLVQRALPASERDLVELWGVTRCNIKFWKGKLTDWDRWFDLHPIDAQGEWEGIRTRRPEAWQWYMRQTKPVYLAQQHEMVKASVTFPLDAVRQQFPVREDVNAALEPDRTITCMVDLLIMFALTQGFERIVLNGIGADSSLQHKLLHIGILYWAGYVRALSHATNGRYEFLVQAPSSFRMPKQIYAYEGFGYDAFRAFRRELSTAQRRARGLTRDIVRPRTRTQANLEGAP